MICKNIVEFLLWNDCIAHGKCAFCWQQARHDCTKFLDEENKLNSINLIYEEISANLSVTNEKVVSKKEGYYILNLLVNFKNYKVEYGDTKEITVR